MNILLEQFLIEGRECLEAMSARLLEIERDPANPELLDDLFRRMHTLKGNSGLFPDLKDFIAVVHAGEDMLDALRAGVMPFSAGLADVMFEALDLISRMLDQIGEVETLGDDFHAESGRLVVALRELLARATNPAETSAEDLAAAMAGPSAAPAPDWFGTLPSSLHTRLAELQQAGASAICVADYTPEPNCFFKGEDPLLLVRQTPGLVALATTTLGPWPAGMDFDPYRSNLRFTLLSNADESELKEHFRYVDDQVQLCAAPQDVVAAQPGAGPATPAPAPAVPLPATQADTAGTDTDHLLRSYARVEGLSEEEHAFFEQILEVQYGLLVAGDSATRQGRWRSVAAVAESLARRIGAVTESGAITRALESALLNGDAGELGEVLQRLELGLTAVVARGSIEPIPVPDATPPAMQPAIAARRATESADAAATALALPKAAAPVRTLPVDEPAPAGAVRDSLRDALRNEDETPTAESGPRILRVRQEKIDRLMDLVGEMVVAKNALPYLAARADEISGARELARDLKANYQVINRISEELQDSIMQVRMLPVGSVFQRFPRLVRDVSRKLGKQVHLEITGEETEADKNIIESLADPLIHILRNSLDHGIESPERRQAAGKPAQGTIRIHAYQESDRVMIEIHDDGNGIDPAVIRAKAYERGLVDETRLGQMSDQEAIQLVFAAGFSTAETISELSGRGVGMDVVRRGIERVHGTIGLESVVGRGTTLRIALPLSMAVTAVMRVRSAEQAFGVPMDLVVETVRVSRYSIHTIKTQRTAVLRGRIVPLFTLNELLGIPVAQQLNDEEELAVLVARIGGEHVGIVVDDFDETLEIILKPLEGVLSGLAGYAGTALLGNGTVLMVLNVKELI